VLSTAFMLAAVACDDGDENQPEAAVQSSPTPAAQIPDVTIGAADYSFDVPSSIPGGLTHFTLQNTGAEDHQALFFRLDEGVTLEDLATGLQDAQTEADFEAFGSFAGGPIAGPGGAFDATLDLAPGSYVLICTIPSPDGVPHADKGMVTTLEVTEPSAEQPPAPDADVTVTLSDFAFDVADTLPAGETVFAVVNGGDQIHEMGMIKLDEGATLDEVLASLEAPEGPYSVVGALYGLASGSNGWTTIDLTPGTYALVCFVTDPQSGQPHIALGMHDSFTVQ
jgi:hypothetical protein